MWMLVTLFNAVLGVLIYTVLLSVWPYTNTAPTLHSISGTFMSSWWFIQSIIYRIMNSISALFTLFVLCLIESFRNVVLNRRYMVLLETLFIYTMSFDFIIALIYMFMSILTLFIVLKLMGLLGLNIRIHNIEMRFKYCVKINVINIIRRRRVLELLTCYVCTIYAISLMWLYMLMYTLRLPIPNPLLSAGLASTICVLLMLRNLLRGCIIRPSSLIITGLIPSGPTIVV